MKNLLTDEKMNKVKEYCVPPTLYFLLLIPHLKLPYFNELPVIDLLFNGLRVLSTLSIFFIFVKRKEKISPALGAFLTLQGVLLLSTLVNQRSIYTFLAENFFQLAVFMLLGLLSAHGKKTIKGLFLIAEILTYLNLAAIIAFPGGLYISKILGYHHNWLLGYKNQMFSFFLSFLIVASLYNRCEQQSIRPYLLAAAILASTLLADSVTSTVTIGIYIVLWLLAERRRARGVNAWSLTAANAVLTAATMGFKYFQPLLQARTGMALTISGRTIIWDRVAELIWQRPILGWGIMSNAESIAISGLEECTIAHNTLLQYLYTGGAAALLCFCAFNLFIIIKLYKHRDSYSGKILAIALFVLNVGGLVEVYSNPVVFMLYGLADNAEKMPPLKMEKSRERYKIIFAVPEKKNQIFGFDLLRTFSMFMVFLFHLNTNLNYRTGIEFIDTIFSVGANHMVCFFMLSGFLLYRQYGGKDWLSADTLIPFYKKRLLKVLPPYLLFLLAAALMRYSLPPESAATVALIPIDVMGLQAFFPAAWNYMGNGGTWFLSVILFLYFIFPLLVTILDRIELRAWKWLLICYISAVWIGCTRLWLGGDFAEYYGNPICRIPEFLFGMALAKMLGDKKVKAMSTRKTMGLCLVITAVYYMTIVLLYDVEFMKLYFKGQYMLYSVISFPAFAGLILLLKDVDKAAFKQGFVKAVSALSNISFYFYLTQGLSNRIIRAVGTYFYLNMWGLLLGSLAVNLALAYIMNLIMNNIVSPRLKKFYT